MGYDESITWCKGELQNRTVIWAKNYLGLTAIGIAAVSRMTPIVSAAIFDKWFTMPYLLLLGPISLLTAASFVFVWRVLQTLPRAHDRYCRLPVPSAFSSSPFFWDWRPASTRIS